MLGSLITPRSRRSTRAASPASAAFSPSAREPPAGKSRAFEAAPDGGHLAHGPPHEIVAVIGCLQEDRSLIDAEIIARDPAVPRIDRAGLDLQLLVGEARVETVPEAVAIEEPGLLH